MKSPAEVRLAIIGQIAEGLVMLNDPGDWTEDEHMEAIDAAEEYASVLLDMLSLEVIDFDTTSFRIEGSLGNVKDFINKYLDEPLVADEF